MSVSVQEFWELAQASGVLPAARCRALADDWQALKGAGRTSSARTLAEWLVSEQAITRYQAKILLAGQPGPFQFADYVVTRRLRRGGLVDCFQAVHWPTQFPVTLRFVRGSEFDPDTDPGDMRRLLAPEASGAREETARRPFLTAAAARPVVPFYEWVDCGAYQFGVFGRFEGEPLGDLLAQQGRFNATIACEMIADAASALRPLHEAGDAHGSLRPEAIWRQASEGIYVLPRHIIDSWEALAGEKPWLTAADAGALGIAEYMAPEAAARSARATPAADVYSLGCILYALLAGHPPFRGSSVAEILQQHASEPVPRLPSLRRVRSVAAGSRGALPRPSDRQLEAFITRLLAKDAAQRPTDAGEMLQALGDVAGLDSSPPCADAEHLRQEAEYLDRLAARGVPTASPAFHLPAATPVAVAQDIADLPAASPHVIGIVPPAPSARLSRQRQIDWRLLVLGFAGAILAATAVAIWHGQGPAGGSSPSRGDPVVQFSGARVDRGDDLRPRPNREAPSALSTRREAPLPDDGQMLWVSPTDGPPVSAAYLPEGTQGILAIRAADLLAHPEGERIVSAAGPSLASAIDTFRAQTGFDPGAIEQLIVGWPAEPTVGQASRLTQGPIEEAGPADLYHRESASQASDEPKNGLGNPTYRIALVLYLRERISLDVLAARLPDARPDEIEGQRVLVREGRAFFLPPAEEGRVVAIVAAAEVDSLVSQTAGPPLRREVEQLLAASDALRHVTLVAPPDVLFGDGRQNLVPERARESLEGLVGPATQGLLLSAHWSEDFFVELKVATAAEKPPWQWRSEFEERLRMMPQRVEDQVLALEPRPYGRRVVTRLPEMLRRLVAYTRSEASADHAVFRCYLPLAAGHNLLLAGELALSEASVATAATRPGSTPPPSLEERLATPTTLVFSRDTLEAALGLLAQDTGIPIEIRGDDLQIEGITKNQSLSIDLVDRPAKEILLEALRLANPDKSASGPGDVRQKLVYVLGTNGAGENTIYITTRAAAESRGELLPTEFRASP